jgi:hypothetical protein
MRGLAGLRVAFAPAVGLALASAGTAHAHSGDTPAVVLTTTPPTLGGVMQPGEWDAASTFVFPGGASDGPVWVVHDDNYLYVAFRRIDPSPSSGFPDDAGDGGTNDMQGAAHSTSGTGEVVFEARHPLCTADVSHDVCLTAGPTFGVTFFYFNETGGQAFYPASFPFQDQFGDLTLVPADTTPPETSITSGPGDYLQTASASLSFDSSETGSTFECRLDGAAFAPRNSPVARGSRQSMARGLGSSRSRQTAARAARHLLMR